MPNAHRPVTDHHALEHQRAGPVSHAAAGRPPGMVPPEPPPRPRWNPLGFDPSFLRLIALIPGKMQEPWDESVSKLLSGTDILSVGKLTLAYRNN